MTSPIDTSIRLEHAITQDGVCLRMLRRVQPAGTPVILLHGLAQNAAGWNHPELGLSGWLHRRGFDVWTPNLRGHGKDQYRSEAGSPPATIDDYALSDLPAIIAAVRNETGRRPFLIGHSMGGIIILMYLTGARYRIVKTDERWSRSGLSMNGLRLKQKQADVLGRRVTESPRLATMRNASILGAVTIASPPVLSWRVKPKPWQLGKYPRSYSNPLLQYLCSMPGASVLEQLVRHLPLRSLQKLLDGADPVRSISRRAVALIAATPLGDQLWNSANRTVGDIEWDIAHTLDQFTAPVIAQFRDWVEHGVCREAAPASPFHVPFDYAAWFRRITVPILFVAGDRDRCAPPYTVEGAGWARVGSADKQMLALTGFGHNDLRLSARACFELFPRLRSWLEARSIVRPEALPVRQAKLLTA